MKAKREEGIWLSLRSQLVAIFDLEALGVADMFNLDGLTIE